MRKKTWKMQTNHKKILLMKNKSENLLSPSNQVWSWTAENFFWLAVETSAATRNNQILNSERFEHSADQRVARVKACLSIEIFKLIFIYDLFSES